MILIHFRGKKEPSFLKGKMFMENYMMEKLKSLKPDAVD